MEIKRKFENHHSFNGTGDLAQKNHDANFVNFSVISNCDKQDVSSMHANGSLCTTQESVNTKYPTISCGNEQPENLSGQFKDQCVGSKLSNNTMAVKEVPVVQNPFSITSRRNVPQTISSNDTMEMLTEKEDDITCVNDFGNEEHLCQERGRKIQCHISTTEVKIPDLSEKTKKNIIESDSKRNQHMCEVKSHSVPGEYREDCIFCAQDNLKVKNKSHDVTMKDKNLEIEHTTLFEEASYGIGSLKLCHRNELKIDSKRKNVKQIDIDLMQPASNFSDNPNSLSNISETKQKCKRDIVLESNETILSRRQKQIEYGKNTTGYRRYKEMVRRDQRTRQDPQTPPKSVKYSRRAWDGLIKTWRRKLHKWDPPKSEESDDEVISIISSFPTLSDDPENLVDSSIGITAKKDKQLVTDQMEIDDVSNNKDLNPHHSKGT